MKKLYYFKTSNSYKFWFSDTRGYYDERHWEKLDEMESWLVANNIKHNRELESIELYSEEDVTAFKLRWQ